MIKLDNISHTLGKKEAKTKALSDISIHIDKGEFITIQGKSGCGKTTLLNVLGGIIKPHHGHYYFNGEDVNMLNDKRIAQFRNQRISFIVQNFALINERRVYDNIIMPFQYRRVSRDNVNRDINRVLEELGITHVKYKYPYQISGGEKQRVAICRAIVSNCDVILADEPTGALDEETGKHIMDILLGLNRQGKTIIMVTHDTELAALGTRRIEMKDGKIV